MLKALLITVGLLIATSVQADHRPSLTLLVGFNPGGSMSQQAELLAELLAEELGESVELLYYPGGGGGAAAAMLAASQANGQIIQFSPSLSFTFSPATLATSFDVNSFDYLAAISRDQLALVSRSHAPYGNWSELLAFAQEQGELVFASQTQLDRLLIHYIAKEENLNVRIVPTSGGRESLLLVLSGEVDLAFGGGAYLDEVKKGRIQPLLALGQQPLAALPEVATLESAGYSLGFESKRVMAMPRGVAQSRRQEVIEALAALVKNPRFVDLTEQQMQLPVVFKTGDALKQFMQRQSQAIDELLALSEGRDAD